MGYKKIEATHKVIVPEGHLENPVAEAVDELAVRLEKMLRGYEKSQSDLMGNFGKALTDKPEQKIEFPKPVKYVLSVTKRDDSGRILEMTATPEIK